MKGFKSIHSREKKNAILILTNDVLFVCVRETRYIC